MWVKTTSECFMNYGIDLDAQRKLIDDEYIMHMQLVDYQFLIDSRNDTNIKWYNSDEMSEILEISEPQNLEVAEEDIEIINSIKAKEVEITEKRNLNAIEREVTISAIFEENEIPKEMG